MRTSCLLFIAVVSSALVTACSGEPDPSGLRRASRDANSETKSGGGTTSPARSSADSSQQQAGSGTPSGTPASAPPSTPAKPATPLAKGVCENPTCTQSNGAWTCLAKDTEGTPVEMDCQYGVCTCFTGDEGTTQFGDNGDLKDEADARGFFTSNCGCL